MPAAGTLVLTPSIASAAAFEPEWKQIILCKLLSLEKEASSDNKLRLSLEKIDYFNKYINLTDEENIKSIKSIDAGLHWWLPILEKEKANLYKGNFIYNKNQLNWHLGAASGAISFYFIYRRCSRNYGYTVPQLDDTNAFKIACFLYQELDYDDFSLIYGYA